MSPRPRPSSVTLLQEVERPDGARLVWVSDGTATICIQYTALGLLNYKLALGLAKEVPVKVNERGHVLETEIVELDSDADDKALEAIIAEHFDAFEEHGHDWHEQHPPDVSAHAGHPGHKVRTHNRRIALRGRNDGLRPE